MGHQDSTHVAEPLDQALSAAPLPKDGQHTYCQADINYPVALSIDHRRCAKDVYFGRHIIILFGLDARTSRFDSCRRAVPDV